MTDIQKKRKLEKIEQILNHQVPGEVYIQTAPREWKRIVLNHFNQVYRNEITLDELIQILSAKGVVFLQKENLVLYPIKECIKYIAKVSGKNIEFKGDNK